MDVELGKYMPEFFFIIESRVTGRGACAYRTAQPRLRRPGRFEEKNRGGGARTFIIVAIGLA